MISAIGGTQITLHGRQYFLTPDAESKGYNVAPVPVVPVFQPADPWSNPEHDVLADFEAYR